MDGASLSIAGSLQQPIFARQPLLSGLLRRASGLLCLGRLGISLPEAAEEDSIRAGRLFSPGHEFCISGWTFPISDNKKGGDMAARQLGRTPVLMYHGILSGGDGSRDKYGVTAANFQKQLATLRTLGLRVITLSE